MAHRTGPSVLGLLGLLALTAALYAPSLRGGVVFEDLNWIDASVTTVQVPSRDLALASHVADLRVDHAINVGLHLLNGALVYGLAQPYGPLVAVSAASVFLLHPLASSAVAYLSARTDLLMTSGVLLAVWLSRRVPTWGRWGLIGLCLLAASASKEVGVMGIGLVAITGQWPSARRIAESRGFVALAIVALVGLGIGLALAGGRVINWFSMAPNLGGSPLPWGAYLSLQLAMLWHLLTLVVWPVGFSVDHDVLAISVTAQRVAWLLTAGCVGLLLTSRRSVVGWTIAWVGISVLPRFIFRTSEFLTEPQLYIAMPAISVLIGSGLAWLWTPVWQERTA